MYVSSRICSCSRYHCRCVTELCNVEHPALVTVEGPVRIRELIVGEGERTVVDTNHIDIQVDYIKAGVAPSDVVFTARALPVHGVLFVTDSPLPQTNVVSFSMSDLRRRRVAYFHDCGEDAADGVDLELRFQAVVASDVPELSRAHNFTLPIRVIPKNDPPTLELPANRTLTLIANSHLHLTASMLKAVDPDDPPENLAYFVEYPPDHSGDDSGSYFTWALSGGNVTRFSQADVDAGRLRLVHRGPPRQHVTLRLTDRQETSDSYRLNVVGVAVRIRRVKNTGLVVELARSSVVIGSDNLTFSCGAVLQNIDVRYELAGRGRYGDVQRRQGDDDGGWKTVTTFTQRQIDDGRVRYYVRLLSAVTVPTTERLRFRVGALTVRDAVLHVLEVRIVDSRVELVRSTGLRLRNGAREGVITGSELRAVSNVRSRSADDITYRIVSTPRRGHLLIMSAEKRRGTALRATDNFTQADIDSGRIAYRLQLALMIPIRDDFEFQLFTPDAKSDVALFQFQYEPPTGDVIFINNGLFDVLEGNHKAIGIENIYTEIGNRSDFRYDVVEGPTHGELRLVDPAFGDVVRYNATTFSNDDIRRQRVFYVHDDSESDRDAFRFVVSRTPDEDSGGDQVDGQFDIAVVLRNDNPPRRVVNSTLTVVANRGRILTTADLLYDDPDTNADADQLVYTWKHIASGEIVAASDRTSVVRRFTQKNLTSGDLYFRHRGAEHASSLFTVNDGLFQVCAIRKYKEETFFKPNTTYVNIKK